MLTQTLAEKLPGPEWEPEETPLSTSGFSEEPLQSSEPFDATMRSGTDLASFMNVATRIFPRRIEGTPLAQTLELVPASCTRVEEPPPGDEVQVIADQRVRLLAREYVNGSNPESDARIEILTARLNRALPPVSDEQWDALATIADDLEAVSARREEIRRRFDLK